VLWGFEVGNEPDLYHSNGFRPSTYTVAGYESQFKLYYDTIRQHVPGAVFTGPTSATNYTSFTLPFCRAMHGKISLLTQHYYVGAANSAPVHKQIVTLLSAAKLNSVVAEVNALVQCADSAGIPFRMGECNSFYNGGQWGASDAFASALWALDYMYALAEKGCGGVNFHGALGGPYTVISRHNNVYTARPLYYGILAFQAGSKGAFIPETITNNHINLNVYSVIDSLQNLYVTLVNKDTLQNAVVDLDAGSAIYTTGEYIALSAPALGDTVNTSLGGQTVDAKGNCAPYSWLVVPVTSNKIRVKVGAGSALIVRLNKGFASGMNVIENNTKNYRVYPNPATSSISVHCDEVLQEPVVIEVYDTKGCRVLRTEMEGQERTLDISFLPEGTYQVRISSNSKMLFQTPVIKAK
jgi:hypothetical protein